MKINQGGMKSEIGVGKEYIFNFLYYMKAPWKLSKFIFLSGKSTMLLKKINV